MNKPVICIGSALIDELYFCRENAIEGTSNPAFSKKFPGGVICNIARHLALLDVPVELITVIGDDSDGRWLRNTLIADGVGMEHSFLVDDNTGKYVSVLNPDGSLFTAACSDICANYLDIPRLESIKDVLKSAALLVTDTNVDEATIEWLITFAKNEKIHIIIEPVSVAKARKLSKIKLDNVFMITPNEDELKSICIEKHDDHKQAVLEIRNRGVQHLWLRKGIYGSVIYNIDNDIFLNAINISVKDSTGAGDAALAGWIAAYTDELDPMDCMKAGHALAFEVLQTHGAVKTDISRKLLYESIKKYYSDGAN